MTLPSARLPAQPPAPRSFVTLGVGMDVFAVGVEHVREILEYRPAVPLPQAPVWLSGMIDVRGCTIPVIDLRRRLGFPAVEPGDLSRILVIDCTDPDLTVGLLADQVFEVAEIEAGAIEPPPAIGVRWKSEYIAGVSRIRGSFLVILNLTRLFSSDEVIALENLG